MTRDEFSNALKNLLEDSCDLPVSVIIEELEDAVMAAHEIERLEAVQSLSQQITRTDGQPSTPLGG